MEKTLILIKPDAIKRGLAGKIITRFEDAGLKIIRMMLFSPPDKHLIQDHYQSNEEWFVNVGKKTIENYQSCGLTVQNVKHHYGTDQEIEIGKTVQQRLMDYLGQGDVIAMVASGNAAVSKVRKMIGFTIPAKAEPGTIRGDFGLDSAVSAAAERRSMENLVHASDSVQTAEREIKLWFKGDV
jgi:nucleoside-diphosphate kinase